MAAAAPALAYIPRPDVSGEESELKQRLHQTPEEQPALVIIMIIALQIMATFSLLLWIPIHEQL